MRRETTTRLAGFWFTYWGDVSPAHRWRPFRTVRFANSLRIDGCLFWCRDDPHDSAIGPIIFTIDPPTWLVIAYCAVAEWIDAAVARLRGRA